jgi:hypothetical protein
VVFLGRAREPSRDRPAADYSQLVSQISTLG